MSVCRKILLSFLLLGLFLTSLFAEPARAQSSPPLGSEFPHARESTSSDDGLASGINFVHLANFDPPPDGQFFVDKAHMINDSHRSQINTLAQRLLHEQNVLILVVTIESIETHTFIELSIERFARELFDHWGLGEIATPERQWQRAILFLVSVEDRSARIELGTAWERDKDYVARRIMDGLVIRDFRQGQFSPGILAGVQGLDKMARNQSVRIPWPLSDYIIAGLLAAGFIALMCLVFLALRRRGYSTWASLLLTALFGTVVAAFLVVLLAIAALYSLRKSSQGGATGHW